MSKIDRLRLREGAKKTFLPDADQLNGTGADIHFLLLVDQPSDGALFDFGLSNGSKTTHVIDYMQLYRNGGICQTEP
jgi:hypothetical protein